MSNDLRAFVCDFQIDKLEFIGYWVLALHPIRCRA